MTDDQLLQEASESFHAASMKRGNELLQELGLRLCSDSMDKDGNFLYHIGHPTIPFHERGMRVGPVFRSGPEALVWLAHHEHFVREELS